MPTAQNEVLPQEKTARKPSHLHKICQEQNEILLENTLGHTSNVACHQQSLITTRKVEKIGLSKDKSKSDRKLNEITEEETIRITSTDLNNAIRTVDKSSLHSQTSQRSNLEFKDVIQRAGNCIKYRPSYRKPEVESNDKSTMNNMVGNLDDQCNFISNNSTKEGKECGSFERMHTSTICDTEASRNSDSDLLLENIFCTDRASDHLKPYTNVSNEDHISCTSKPNLDVKKEILPFYDEQLPQYFYSIAEGLFVHCESGCPIGSKPTWFDPDKFQLGQKVAMKYFFGIQFAQMVNLLIALSILDGVTPLIFSGQSDTPFKAFKRYLSTGLRVRSWFQDDLWDPKTEGYKNIRRVRKMHDSFRNLINVTDPQELIKKGTLCRGSKTFCPATWSPLHDKLRNDFEASCPSSDDSQFSLSKPKLNYNFGNQTEMAVAQFGFVGLFILYPAYFGAHRITDEELEGFVFLWRCIGYLLGMDDKYNFCNGSLGNIKQRTSDFIERLGKPSLRAVSRDWEHMMRCFTEGNELKEALQHG
ncbi:hypothetical protein C0J52_07533 [Blattella germanica]|nr:hypothetical protein C0J52_07533 [Blattella germanica]